MSNDMTPGSDPDPAGGPGSGVARKVVVGSLGGAVTAAGVVMLVTPGPGILVTLAGLGILAKEFPFAATQLERIKDAVSRRRNDGD